MLLDQGLELVTVNWVISDTCSVTVGEVAFMPLGEKQKSQGVAGAVMGRLGILLLDAIVETVGTDTKSNRSGLGLIGRHYYDSISLTEF